MCLIPHCRRAFRRIQSGCTSSRQGSIAEPATLSLTVGVRGGSRRKSEVFSAWAESRPYYATKSEMTGGRIDALTLSGRRPVAQAVVRRAQMRTALDHPPRYAFARR